MTALLPAVVAYQPEWWDILQAPFMRNAFLGGTLVALLAGVVGYFVVIRTSSFAAHALAHIGFPGATGAVLLGLPVTLGLAVFCTAGALAIGALGRRVGEREIATGTILAFATGLGVLFASLSTRSTGVVTSVLFGNLLAISPGQLAVFAGFTVVVLVALAVVFRPLLFASVDLEVAEARAVPVRALGVVFLLLLALTVTMAVQVVGTLLLFALVVTPAATALRWTARPGRAVLAATAVSLLSVWSGLLVAAVFDLPPSFVIVTVAFLVWFGTWWGDRRRHQVGDPRPAADHHHGAGARP